MLGYPVDQLEYIVHHKYSWKVTHITSDFLCISHYLELLLVILVNAVYSISTIQSIQTMFVTHLRNKNEVPPDILLL